MKYRGYIARIDYESKSEIFVGRLLGMAEPIAFHGASVEELLADFHFAVDHYLAECQRMGHKPGRPASGKLLLRLAPDTHANAIVAAAAAGISTNQWLAQAIEKAIENSAG
jgi:predicted HicB family RNase H-like nuclease